MLYEMMAIVRIGKVSEVKEIAQLTGQLVLAQGGVVRGITNWGTYLLTKPIKKLQRRHDSGQHFIIRFDASPTALAVVKKTIAVDPRMVRVNVVKLGETLKEIAPWEGKARWSRKEDILGGGLGEGLRLTAGLGGEGRGPLANRASGV